MADWELDIHISKAHNIDSSFKDDGLSFRCKCICSFCPAVPMERFQSCFWFQLLFTAVCWGLPCSQLCWVGCQGSLSPFQSESPGLAKHCLNKWGQGGASSLWQRGVSWVSWLSPCLEKVSGYYLWFFYFLFIPPNLVPPQDDWDSSWLLCWGETSLNFVGADQLHISPWEVWQLQGFSTECAMVYTPKVVG